MKYIVTKIEFLIKKSRFKESKCADKGHLLKRDFTVVPCGLILQLEDLVADYREFNNSVDHHNVH